MAIHASTSPATLPLLKFPPSTVPPALIFTLRRNHWRSSPPQWRCTATSYCKSCYGARRRTADLSCAQTRPSEWSELYFSPLWPCLRLIAARTTCTAIIAAVTTSRATKRVREFLPWHPSCIFSQKSHLSLLSSALQRLNLKRFVVVNRIGTALLQP